MDLKASDDILQAKWKVLKPQIRKHWRKITKDDLDRLNGETDELINVLRRRYGYGKAQAGIEINRWLIEQDDGLQK